MNSKNADRQCRLPTLGEGVSDLPWPLAFTLRCVWRGKKIDRTRPLLIIKKITVPLSGYTAFYLFDWTPLGTVSRFFRAVRTFVMEIGHGTRTDVTFTSGRSGLLARRNCNGLHGCNDDETDGRVQIDPWVPRSNPNSLSASPGVLRASSNTIKETRQSSKNGSRARAARFNDADDRQRNRTSCSLKTSTTVITHYCVRRIIIWWKQTVHSANVAKTWRLIGAPTSVLSRIST